MDQTILLVDDDRCLLRALAELLRSCGYSVLEHADPFEALQCVRLNAEINCVLTDIDMPSMDGISFLGELRRIRPMLNGLLMTGKAHRAETPEDILQKPFTF